MRATRGRARIGVLVPFTNSNLEPDLTLLLPVGISFHVARMGGYDEDAIPDETQMQALGTADLDTPLALLAGVRPDVILYGCTSATLTHGPDFDRALATRIEATCGAKTVTAAGALVHALKSLNATKIGFASPYVPAINDRAIGFLAQMGIETVARSEVDAPLGNHEQGALSPDAVFELGLKADSDAAEALVLSCTDMRSVEVVARLEEAVGKPVVCSNQAMVFEALGMLGLREVNDVFGQLFRMVGR
ncbi:MAG: Asp/Glu racemase [Pseudomonadota bacterium]